MKPSGISVRALSRALHVHHSRVREIVNGNRGVSADTAVRLARHFGGDAQGWLNLQSAFDLAIAEASSAQATAENVSPLAMATHNTNND